MRSLHSGCLSPSGKRGDRPRQVGAVNLCGISSPSAGRPRSNPEEPPRRPAPRLTLSYPNNNSALTHSAVVFNMVKYSQLSMQSARYRLAVTRVPAGRVFVGRPNSTPEKRWEEAKVWAKWQERLTAAAIPPPGSALVLLQEAATCSATTNLYLTS